MSVFKLLDPGKRTADFTKIKSHPRLLFTPEKINFSKTKIESDGLYKRFYEETKSYADKAIRDVVPKQTDEHFGFVWRYTAFLPMLGSMYLLSEDKKYYNKTIEWLSQFIDYKFNEEHPDLDISLASISTALIYDWFYDELPGELKEAIKKKLLHCAQTIYNFANLDKDFAWIKMVMQNHNHLAIASLGTIALSIYDEYPEQCRQYIETAVSRFSATFEITGDDGGFHEGFGYWYYGFLTPFMLFHMLNDNVDVNFFEEKWFEKVPDYLLFNYYGENDYTNRYEYFPFADDVGYKRTKECMLRLVANITKHPYLQHFAQVSYDKKLTTYHGAFLNFIWNDPELLPKALKDSDYPLSHHFENYDYLYARENWSGNESCFAIHCGNPLGKKWQKLIKNVPFYELGAAHSHPDAGHFILFGKGQPLFYDDEYSYNKQTVQHNTLLINGKGQKGENIDWFNVSEQYIDSYHTIEYCIDNNEYLLAAADMKDAYSDDSSVTELKRYFLYIRNADCLIIYDKIRAEKENEISAYFWPWDKNIFEYAKNKFLITGEKANIKLQGYGNLSSKTVTKENYTRYHKKSRRGITFETKVKDGEFIYAVSFCHSSEEPCEVELNKTENGFSVTVKNKKYQVNLLSEDVKIENAEENIQVADPLKLFANGQDISEYTSDIKEYNLKKLPWQDENYFFFSGTGYSNPEYKVNFSNHYPVGLGKLGIKNISANSCYYQGDVMNVLTDDKDEMWICDLLDDYMVIELDKTHKINSVIVSFGYFERFRTKIEVLCSENGTDYKLLYTGTPCEDVLKVKIDGSYEGRFIKIINCGNSYNSFLNINGVGIE